MKNPLAANTLLLAAAVLTVLVPGGARAQAPSAAAKAKPTPRMANGKPDLSGFWQGPLLRNMDKNVPGGFNAILTPAGKAAYEFNKTKSVNPEGLCLFAGIPRASISGVPFEIVQSANRVAFLYELMWTFRTIPLDGRDHPKEFEPTFFGNSIAKWDGDTLIIDSMGFKDKLTWLDDDAHPHSDAMHVVEKWWSPDAEHLNHEVTVTDPRFYTKPFSFDRVYKRMPAGQEIMEFACDENNIDREGGHLGFGPHDPGQYKGIN